MILSTISRYSGDLAGGIEIGEPSRRLVGPIEVIGSIDPAGGSSSVPNGWKPGVGSQPKRHVRVVFAFSGFGGVGESPAFLL